MKILAINPGSTSTKIALFEDKEVLFETVLRHPDEILKQYSYVMLQYQFRKLLIQEELHKQGIDMAAIDAYVARGGLLKPLVSGTYRIDEKLVQDCKNASKEHASNLAAMIAYEFASNYKKESFIVDPVVVDELAPVARITGLKEIKRTSIFHALNQKAVAKRHAASIHKRYEDLRLIVAHLGGGISVGVHELGKVVEVNNALSGEGPFSSERAGGLPVVDVLEYAYANKLSLEEIKKKLIGQGGVVSYLQVNDMRKVTKMADDGNEDAMLILDAMAYQVAREIGAGAAVLCGQIDGILLTGGIAYSKEITSAIQKRISFLADVTVYPGEDEMLALCEGAYRVLTKQEEAIIYV